MFKNILFSIITLLTIFVFFELIIRIFFPVYNYNAIFYEKNDFHKVFKGVDTFFSKNSITDKFLIRVKNKDENKDILKNKKKIIFIGDSISLGYGVKYEENYIELVNSKVGKKYQVIGLSNLNRDYIHITNAISEDLASILNEGDKVIYQFSYNDIIPNDYHYKETFKNKDTKVTKIVFKKFQKIKFKYLNHSSLIKFLNYHFSLLNQDINGECLDRKYSSLGQYTFAFFSEGFEKQSEISWLNFRNKIKQTEDLLSKRKIDFKILISPISLQLKYHQSSNKLNFDMRCSKKNGYTFLKSLILDNKIGLIDPLYLFKEAETDRSRKLFHEFDTAHFNKFGHELLAEEVFKQIIN